MKRLEYKLTLELDPMAIAKANGTPTDELKPLDIWESEIEAHRTEIREEVEDGINEYVAGPGITATLRELK